MVTTSLRVMRPLLMVSVVISLTTVPSGCVEVVVLVVDVVELVVTGAGGRGAGGSGLLEEQPATGTQAIVIARTKAANLRTEPMHFKLPTLARRVKQVPLHRQRRS